MVDVEARRIAAALVARFRDRVITNDEFEDEWPRRSPDRALNAIAAALWGAYSDTHRHALTGRYALTEAGRAFFDRCIQFLKTDLEYEWPQDRYYARGGLHKTPLIMSLGLLLPVHWMLKRRHAQQEAAGDSAVWPFIRRADIT
jgi:hypothetical protein